MTRPGKKPGAIWDRCTKTHVCYRCKRVKVRSMEQACPTCLEVMRSALAEDVGRDYTPLLGGGSMRKTHL